jgi:hypothetical protein
MSKMSLDVRDYLKIYDDFVDIKLCKKIVKKIKKEEWGTHSYYEPVHNTVIVHDRELSVCYGTGIPETKELQDKLWFGIDRYIREDIGECNKWYNSWSGYNHIRYNKYDVNTEMLLHCDHIHTMFDGTRKGIPTLTILGALNDDYEGGELMFWDQEKIDLKAGQIMIFPSNFLYPHQVKPVTKGVRFSYVSWVW